MQICAKKTTNNRITEYPQLEGIFKDHHVQLLAPNGTTQQSDHVSDKKNVLLVFIYKITEKSLKSRMASPIPQRTYRTESM